MDEFKGWIEQVEDRTVRLDVTDLASAGIKRYEPVRHARIEFCTDGPFPYDQLRSLVGRRIKVTVLD